MRDLTFKLSSLLMAMLYFIVIGAENCFYLIDTGKTNIAGTVNYMDIFIVLAMLWFIIVMYFYRRFPNPKFEFKWIILSIIILAVMSSIESYILYQQGFLLGFRPQRFWIIWGLLYFPIRKMVYIKKITIEQIIKMVFVIGTIEIILYIAQYFLNGKFDFLHVYTNERYGGERFYFSNIFLNLLLFINVDNVFNRKKGFKSTFYIVTILFVLIIVGKMRMTSLAVFLSCIFGLLIWRKGREWKLVSILILIIVSLFSFNIPIIQDTVSRLTEYGTGQFSSSSNLLIRMEGRAYYVSQLFKNPIFGCGFISELDDKATSAAGFNKNIYLVDNGIFAFAFIYGVVGICWVIVLFSKMFRDSWYIYKRKNMYFFILVPLYWVIAMQTELHWYWNNGFFVVTLLIVMLEENKNLLKQKNSVGESLNAIYDK